MKYLLCGLLFAFPVCQETKAQTGAEWHKMSTMVRRVAKSQVAAPVTRGAGGGGRKLCAFVKVTDDGLQRLKDEGCQVLASFGDIHIADIPVDRLRALSLDSRVLRIEASRPLRVLNDSSAIRSRSLDVRLGKGLSNPFTGRGVVVGLLDVGFDLTHPNFYSADRQHYRIKQFWDMLAIDDKDVSGGQRAEVGAVFSDSVSILRHARSVDSHVSPHGTHTLGTAAGSGAGTSYLGMAPESDIVLASNCVSADIELVPDSLLDRYTTATDMLAVSRMFDYATSVGLPCVVSCSEGSPDILSEDSKLFSDVLDQITGPGRIFVAAAGNNGDFKSYLYKPASTPMLSTFLDPRYYSEAAAVVNTDGNPKFRIVVWKSEAERDTIAVSGEELTKSEDGAYSIDYEVNGKNYTIEIASMPDAYDEGNHFYVVDVSLPDYYISYPKFQLDVENSGTPAEITSVYGQLSANSVNPEAMEGERSHSGSVPANYASAISVGATAWRRGVTRPDGSWFDNSHWGYGGVLAGFSSIGPSSRGLTKPDVVAPGVNVFSSSNSYYDENHTEDSDYIVRKQQFNGRAYAWRSDMGTSMSTPAVAGIIAQWLEANPRLTPDDVKQVIARTARPLDTASEVPNSRWGYGEIDAYAGIVDILGLSGIAHASQPVADGIDIVPAGEGRVRIVAARHDAPCLFTVRLYSPGGQIVKHLVVTSEACGECTVSAPQRGVYLVQVITADNACKASRLVRL